MRRVLLFLPLLLFLSCDWLFPPDYVPLGKNYTWTYEGTDAGGSFTQTSTAKTAITCPNNKPGWAVEETVTRSSGTNTTTVFLCRTEDQLVQYPDTNSTDSFVLLMLPLEDNAGWLVGTDPILGSISALVIGKENLSLPYGEVKNCHKIQYEWKIGAISVLQYVWYGPNLGRVKWTAPGNTDYVTELKSFHK